MAVSSIDRRTINRGETLGFTFGLDSRYRDALPLECKVTIQTKRGGDDLITPIDVEQNSRGMFVGKLTADETDLPAGEYFVVARITGQGIYRELERRLTLLESW